MSMQVKKPCISTTSNDEAKENQPDSTTPSTDLPAEQDKVNDTNGCSNSNVDHKISQVGLHVHVHLSLLKFHWFCFNF